MSNGRTKSMDERYVDTTTDIHCLLEWLLESVEGKETEFEKHPSEERMEALRNLRGDLIDVFFRLTGASADEIERRLERRRGGAADAPAEAEVME